MAKGFPRLSKILFLKLFSWLQFKGFCGDCILYLQQYVKLKYNNSDKRRKLPCRILQLLNCFIKLFKFNKFNLSTSKRNHIYCFKNPYEENILFQMEKVRNNNVLFLEYYNTGITGISGKFMNQSCELR